MAFPQRTYTEVPADETMAPQIREFLGSLLSQVNALQGRGAPPAGQGIAALSVKTIDPTTGQIISAGSRVSSIITPIAFTSTSTSFTFWWDGSNGSMPLQIFRDDGSVVNGIIAGSGLLVSNLSPSTKYFFYPYWDETQQAVRFVSIPGTSVGTPAIAFTAQSVAAFAQQLLRNHIPMASSLATTGITTPASGTGGGSGGGGGGGGSGCPLSGAPVRLYGDPAWWTKTVVPNEEFYRVVTMKSGPQIIRSSVLDGSCEAYSLATRIGIFSRTDQRYCRRGLLPLSEWSPDDFALTEDGEEKVQLIEPMVIPGASVDRYEATEGHIYSAWGFIGHNFKPF